LAGEGRSGSARWAARGLATGRPCPPRMERKAFGSSARLTAPPTAAAGVLTDGAGDGGRPRSSRRRTLRASLHLKGPTLDVGNPAQRSSDSRLERGPPAVGGVKRLGQRAFAIRERVRAGSGETATRAPGPPGAEGSAPGGDRNEGGGLTLGMAQLIEPAVSGSPEAKRPSIRVQGTRVGAAFRRSSAGGLGAGSGGGFERHEVGRDEGRSSSVLELLAPTWASAAWARPWWWSVGMGVEPNLILFFELVEAVGLRGPWTSRGIECYRRTFVVRVAAVGRPWHGR